MPRFFDPERYNEDWYIELKGEYQKFFDYIIETCDCAGVWKPNKIDFETKTGFKINLDSLLSKVNKGKERLLVLNNGRWFLPGFIKFQYFNRKAAFELDNSNNLHKGILTSLKINSVNHLNVWGLVGVKLTSKDKEKDKEVKTIREQEDSNVPKTPIGSDVTIETARRAWGDQMWRESLCMGLSIGEPDLKKWMAQFNASISNDTVENFNDSSYKKMFRGWLNKELGKGNKVDYRTHEAGNAPPLKR